MKIEVTDNQQFSDWSKDVLININTSDFLRLSLKDAVSLIRMLGVYAEPSVRMYYSYNANTIRDISGFLEKAMTNLKMPKTYIGLKKIGTNKFFAEIKVLGAPSLPINPASCETLKLVWYDTKASEAKHAKLQKAVNLDEIADDVAVLDKMLAK